MKERYKKDLSKYEGLRYWNKKTLTEYIREWADKYGDRTAVIADDDELTYSEVDSLSDERAFGLSKLGLKKGDTAAIQLPNSAEYVITLFALYKLGVKPVLVLPAHREAELASIMETAAPKAYIIPDKYMGYEYLPLARKLKSAHSCLEYIIVDGDITDGDDSVIQIKDVTAESGELPELDPYDTLHYLLSGGSTGVPKLIARTHSDYMYLCKLCCDRCELTSDDVYLVALPCEHNFPTGDPGFLGIMDVGGTAVFCGHISPDEVLDMITEYEVTVTALVPTMVSMCIDMLEIDDDFDISSLRILQVGGSVFDDSAAERAINAFSDTVIMQVFGTSEGLIITTLLSDSRETIKKYQGKALPDQFIGEECEATEIRIVDSEDNDVADGEYGEVLCKGPYIIDEYYGLGDADLSSFTADGFYRTGDKAMRTPDGYYKFVGRIKEQINRAGEKIMPAELEEHLCMYERVQDAAVIGVPDPEMGNKIYAFIVSEDNNEVTMEEVFDHLTKKGVARYKFPDRCITLDALPLTAVGKKDGKKLLEIAGNEDRTNAD